MLESRHVLTKIGQIYKEGIGSHNDCGAVISALDCLTPDFATSEE